MLPPCLAELVVLGQLRTMDAALPRAEGMAIAAGRIVRVGSAAEVRACAGPDTEVFDLGGAVVLPGFLDAHAHPGESGVDLANVDLSATTTEAEALTTMLAWAAANPGRGWILGGGWDSVALGTVRPRLALDLAFGSRPVALASADGHSVWANSAAIRAAGLENAPDPRGGIVERGPDGLPTGVLRESAADAVIAAAPPPSRAAIDTAERAALRELARYGITTVVEAATDAGLLAGWARLERRGELTARVFAAVPVEPEAGLAGVRAAARLARRYHSEKLTVNAVKLFVDGVLETETAAVLVPYTDGVAPPPAFTSVELDTVFSAARAAHLQVHAHTIGDAAVRAALDAEARATAHGPPPLPLVLAHLELVDPADIPRFAALGVVADVQADWAWPDPYVTEGTAPRIGQERTARLYPIGALARAGASLAAGSDWSVTTLNPWPAIEAAITRADPEAGGAALAPDQAVSLATMLAAYTTGGAAMLGQQGQLGVLRAGAHADFVVLDHDPDVVVPERLSEVGVLATYVDGIAVFARWEEVTR